MNKDQETLIFVHIPKAAGTTLNKIIERQYPPDAVVTFGGYGLSDSIKAFLALPEEERAKVRCLKGHMPFGLDEFMPRPCAYITMLRDPVERIVSFYYFVRSIPHHPQYADAQSMSIAEFVESGLLSQLNSGQVRFLSGLRGSDSIFWEEAIPDGALEAAKANLSQRCLAVGLAERFDESLLLYGRILGWDNVLYVRENVTPGKASARALSARDRAVIERHNELDLELYEHGRKLFDEAYARHGIDDEAVAAFRRRNRKYEMIRAAASGVTAPVKRARRVVGRVARRILS